MTDPRDRPKVVCHSNAGAIQFEAYRTEGKNGYHTISIEVAPRNGKGNGAPLDWSEDSKIRLQLSEQELPLLVACLYGYLPSFTVNHRGPEVSLERQRAKQHGENGRVYVKAMRPNGAHTAFPLFVDDVFRLAVFALQHLALQAMLPPELVLPAVKSAASLNIVKP
jgi:hypothetical protein